MTDRDIWAGAGPRPGPDARPTSLYDTPAPWPWTTMVFTIVLYGGFGDVVSSLATWGFLPRDPAVFAIVSLALRAVVTLLWIGHVVRVQEGSWSSLFGLRLLVRDLGIGAVAAIVVYGVQMVIAIVIASRVGPIPDDGIWKQEGSLVGPAAFAVVALLGVTTAPIIEEIVFRAMLLRSLAARLGVADRIAVASLIFGLGHVSAGVAWQTNLMTVVLAGVFGAAMCILARATGRLGPGLVAHALTNLVGFSILISQLS